MQRRDPKSKSHFICRCQVWALADLMPYLFCGTGYSWIDAIMIAKSVFVRKWLEMCAGQVGRRILSRVLCYEHLVSSCILYSEILLFFYFFEKTSL